MIKVELLPAFKWFCEECGQENFLGALVPDEHTQRAINEELGTDAVGEWLAAPDTVRCELCNSEYETMEYGDE